MLDKLCVYNMQSNPYARYLYIFTIPNLAKYEYICRLKFLRKEEDFNVEK